MSEKYEDFGMDPLDLFKTDLGHNDSQTQLRALHMLSTVAVALDVDRTRDELVPFLEDYLYEHIFECDTLLVVMAEQLGKFVPFIGGPDYAHLLFPMLTKLAASDEMETGEKAVMSLKNIASQLKEEQLEQDFITVIEQLAQAEWFTSKCSAAPLFAVAYRKVREPCRQKLLNMFSNLLQDESPMVRRAAATSLTDFIIYADMEEIKKEFIPSFKDLAKDDQDSVRILAVNVAISLSFQLTTDEIVEHIMSTLQALCDDSSWRVRYRCAFEINNIQSSIGPNLTRLYLIDMYKSLIRDTEANIREISARNIVRFCQNLQTSYKELEKESGENLDPIIQKEILPLIQELDQDPAEDVQDGLYSVITSLSTLLGEKCTKDFLVPLITRCIENDSSKVKENIINSLNNILCVIGIDDLSKTVEKLISDLLKNSNTLWRTRRNLIVTLSHIAKHSKQEYFDEHLKHLYVSLLKDAINGVRRVAPLALPIFVKHYTMSSWGKENIIKIILELAGTYGYRIRLMSLFCIDELVLPTLDKKSDGLLTTLKCIQDENSSIVLNKIHKLNEILSNNFNNVDNEWLDIVLKYCEDENYFNDNIKCFAEDSFDDLRNCVDQQIIAVGKNEIDNPKEESYLEGILFLIVVCFMDVIRELAQDKVYNVRMRAARTLHRVKNLNKQLTEELNQPWVNSVLNILSNDERETINIELQNDLTNGHIKFLELKRDVFIAYIEDIPDVPILEAKDIKEELEKIELEQQIAESIDISETLEKVAPNDKIEVGEAATEFFLAKEDFQDLVVSPNTSNNPTPMDQSENSEKNSSTKSIANDAPQVVSKEAVFISDDIEI
ncbi:serine/threonine-protein phosphatase 2A 65 kDa regulatory subunit A alpha isoform-like [Onthophagus taurus]|uniref:serine/threonine-protein phosphatase 2A 65 kDa regulatory subunit A alpha isoform-like n=1 Tax=Onthophagus taurus TaxID=166361 RepID=UPI0039BE149B